MSRDKVLALVCYWLAFCSALSETCLTYGKLCSSALSIEYFSWRMAEVLQWESSSPVLLSLPAVQSSWDFFENILCNSALQICIWLHFSSPTSKKATASCTLSCLQDFPCSFHFKVRVVTFLKERFSLCSLGWPIFCYVDQVGLKLTDPSASVSQVWGPPGCGHLFCLFLSSSTWLFSKGFWESQVFLFLLWKYRC